MWTWASPQDLIATPTSFQGSLHSVGEYYTFYNGQRQLYGAMAGGSTNTTRRCVDQVLKKKGHFSYGLGRIPTCTAWWLGTNCVAKEISI